MKKGWQKVAWILSIAVVFVVTYALILPAITIEHHTAEETPGIENISGEEAGNSNVQYILTCSLAEHTHSESCYSEQVKPEGYQIRICHIEEHSHTDGCYNEDGELVCTLEEHTHDSSCYLCVGLTEENCVVYSCGLLSHAHSESCYDEDGRLVCALEEHEHSEDCINNEYETGITCVYTCGLKAHEHDESCYDTDGNLVCTMLTHTHSSACTEEFEPEFEKVLSCGEEEHVHSAPCYTVVKVEDDTDDDPDEEITSSTDESVSQSESSSDENVSETETIPEGESTYDESSVLNNEDTSESNSENVSNDEVTSSEKEDVSDLESTTAPVDEDVSEPESTTVSDDEDVSDLESTTAPVDETDSETETSSESDDEEIVESSSDVETEPDSTALEEPSTGPAPKRRNRDEADPANVSFLSVSTSFRNGATLNDNGDYVWTANNSNAHHAFIYRITYSMSGLQSISANSVEIRLPASILKDLNGDPADYFEISLPHETDPKLNDPVTAEKISWVYRIEEVDGEPVIVVYNRKEVPSAEQGYFEISYKTNQKTFFYPDYDPSVSAEDSVTGNARNGSDPVVVTISCGDKSKTVEAPPVYIDTTARVTSNDKTVQENYSEWQSDWGEEPDDSEDYVYLVWRVRSVIINPTQVYDFSLVDTFNPPGCEVVGYKMQGESVYRSAAEGGGVERGCTREYRYGRYDHVLTRYLASEYEGLEYFKLTNKVDSIVTPVQGVDDPSIVHTSGDYIYEPHPFVVPEGWFYAYKYGLDSANEYVTDSTQIRNYELTAFHEGERDDIVNLQYYTYLHGTPNAFTVPRGMSTYETENYWQVPVTYTLCDWEFELKPMEVDNDGYTMLSPEDYEITDFRLDILENDCVFSSDDGRFNQTNVTYTDDDIVYLYVAVNGEMDGDEPIWYLAATLDLKTNTYWTDSDYVESRSGRTFYFKNDENQAITGYKVQTTNAHYYTKIGGYPTIRLKNSELVRNVVDGTMQSGNQHKISVKNSSHSHVTQELVTWDQETDTITHTGEELYLIGFDKEGFDYATGIIRHGRVDKKVKSYVNDTVDQAYRVTWDVTASESYIDTDGETKFVWQNSGTLYDLLPLGGICLTDTISVFADGERLEAGQYTVETILNYKETGRTLLVVHIGKGAYKYEMAFSSAHPWDSIAQYSSELINDVLYETGNPDLGDGSTCADWVVGLDGVTSAGENDEKFVYDIERHTVNAITAASIGLYKKVLAQGDRTHVYETTTPIGAIYEYLLHFTIADGISYARDMILFDSIENYIPEDDLDGGDWRGTIESFDLTRLRELGCEPVLYLTEDDSFDPALLNKDYDFDANSAIWTEKSEYDATHADLSAVRGFAIDLRESSDPDEDGFVLSPEEALYVKLYMRAPAASPENAPDPVVYNNICLYSTIFDPMAPELAESDLIVQDYTTVHLRAKGDLKLRKLNADDLETPVEGAVFELSGTSVYETDYHLTRTTDQSGFTSFEGIEMGSYVLQEVDATPDYQLDPTLIYITIDGYGNLIVTGASIDPETGAIISQYPSLYFYDGGSGEYIIVNEPRFHGDFSFLKYGNTDGSSARILLEGVRFKLEGNSTYGNHITMYAVSGANGLVSFSNIEIGTYKLTELTTMDGYIVSDREYTVIVRENGLVTVSYVDEETGETVTLKQNTATGELEIDNDPLHHFNLLKTDAVSGEPLTGAQFRLKGKNSKDEYIDITEETDENGVVHFTDLEPGEYVLTETVAPPKHELDPTPRAVIVADDGTVTIDGLTIDGDFHWFPYPNERKLDGTVRIIKVWNDAGYENERPIPTVNISATEPDFSLPVATIDRGEWNSIVCNGTTGSSNNLRGKTRFVRSETPLEGSARIDDQSTDWSVTVLADGDTIYWWSDAEIVYLPENCSGLFKNANKLTSLDLSGFNTSKVNNMSEMFLGCSYLESVNLSSFVTSNVTNMDNMFNDCIRLTSLDLRNFDTSSVTSMKAMFNNCQHLTDLNVTSFDTSNVTNMNSMFAGCSSLTELDLTHFNTSSVTNMANMFSGCSSLTDLDVTRFDTSNVTTMNNMFSRCSSLTSLDLSHFNTSNVTNMANMFSDCSSLTDLDVSHFDTSSVTTMANMFSGCSSLTDLDLTSFDTSSVTNMSSMFNGCSSLNDPDLTSFDTSSVTNMSSMFSGCSGMTDLDVTRFNTSSVTNMESMFKNCSSLTSLDVTHFDTSNVTNMNSMFENCSSLTSLDVTHFDTSKVISMSSMFAGCSSLTSLDVTHFDTSKVIGISSMFKDCSSLTSLDVSRLDTSKCQSLAEMFSNCEQLTSLDVSHLDTSAARSMANMFSGCKRLGNLDLSHFDTSVCHTFNQMFQDCDAMTRIDCSSFNLCATRQSGSSTTQVGYISLINMFADCDNVTDIVLKANDVQKPLIMTGLCQDCPKLKNFTLLGEKADGTNAVVPVYSATSATAANSLQDVFNGCTSLEIADFTTIDSFKTTSSRQVVSTDRMFRNCSSLTELHLPKFSTAGTGAGRIGTATDMFAGCSNLQKVWVNPTYWSKPSGSSARMFKDCVEIVGQNGTAYNPSKIDKTYACVDAPSTPGYFWDAANIVNDPTTGETVSAFTPPVALGNLAPNAVVLIPPEDAETEDPELIPPLDPVQAPVASGDPGDHEPVQTDYTTRGVMWDETYGDSSTARDCWIDNGDGTWTYRMPVFDEDNTYYGWENELFPYSTDYSLTGRNWVGGDSIRLEYTGNSTGDAGCVLWVRNARSPVNPEYSNLTVTKRLEALTPSGELTAVPEEDKNVEFRFIVRLNKLITGQYGDMFFENGIATFTLKGDETATATRLPEDVEYVVEEETVDGFTPTSENESGTIPGGTIAHVTYKNTETVPEKGKLQLYKQVIPAENVELTEYDYTRRFTFTVTLTDETPDQSLAPQIEGRHVFGDLIFNDGVATVTLSHDESVMITDLPVGLNYRVREAPEDDFETSAQYDSGVISANTALVATAEFTNVKTHEDKFGNFTLKKRIAGNPTTNRFNFWVDLSDLRPNETYHYGDETFTADNNGNAFIALSLAHNESVTFTKLPVGAHYTITELETGFVASYTVTEQNSNGTVTGPSGSNRQTDKPLSTQTETVEENEDALVEFVNTPPEFDVSFLKTDEEGGGLAGAVLQVLSGEIVVHEWMTTGEIQTFSLSPGKYILHEASAPDEYSVADDIPFEVDKDGKVYLLDDNNERIESDPLIVITMIDPPLKILFPSLGGFGVIPFIICGVAVMAAAGIYILLRIRKRERGNVI